jgi:hypothetical protein
MCAKASKGLSRLLGERRGSAPLALRRHADIAGASRRPVGCQLEQVASNGRRSMLKKEKSLRCAGFFARRY